MIDMHYDMLSVIYYCYKKNDFSYIKDWAKNYREDNVRGLIANLYFMNPEEMKLDFGKYYDPDISVLDMFKIAVREFKKYLPNIPVIFSIEGCDYIKDTSELEDLYNEGLRNILLVWNNPNKYGSGDKDDYGLTELGKEFLIKAIDLGISIDLSHMNRKTFDDTVLLLRDQKKLGKDVKVIVSHSNCYDLHPNMRNLTDIQLKSIKEFDPVIGLVSYQSFTCSDSLDIYSSRNTYLEHIKRVVDILGIDSVGVSTDDMSFRKDLLGFSDYGGDLFNVNSVSSIDGGILFNYDDIVSSLKELLSKNFNEEEINKILYNNIYNKLFRKEVVV